MRRKLISSILCVAMVAALAVTGCENKEAVASDDTKMEKTAKTFTEEDLEGIISGLEDHYILEEAEEIDYQYNVEYDEDIIVGIKDNGEKKVDTGKTGTYTVTYTVTVDNQKLTEYLEQKAEEEESADKEDSSDTTESEDNTEDADKEDESDDMENEGATDIEIDKDMTVVDKDKAQDLADQDEVVWGDKNETVEKSDGTEVEEETKEPEETENKNDSSGNTSSDQNTNTSAGNSGGNSSNNGNASGGNGNSGGNSGNNENTSASNSGATTTTPVHTHNWEYKEEGHYYNVTIYESRAVCNVCGHESLSTDEAILHSAECGGGYTPRKVPVGTDQQWVVDRTYYICTGCGATK